ncbi:MAG: isopeptide-forming domain-containing fimbrial protein [Planctomycetaceae bacterium]
MTCLNPKTLHLLTSLSLLTVTGCATLMGTDYREEYAQQTDAVNEQPPDKPLVVEPFGGEPQGVARVTPRYPQASASAASFSLSHPEFEPLSRTHTAANEPENPFAVRERSQIQQMSFEVPETGPVSAPAGTAKTTGSTSTTTFRPADPRLPTDSIDYPPPASVTVGECPAATAFPDEYIFDGGDRDIPVHYFAGEMAGLDTEDTVAEFKDHTGGSHVKASNRVAVYAPRFGAVETVTGPGIDVKVDKAAGAVDVAGLGALHDQRGLDINTASTPASGMAVRSSASGIEVARPAHQSENAEGAVLSTKVDQGFESKMTQGPSRLNVTSEFELNIQILEPVTSETQTALGLSASTSQATLTFATFRLQAVTGSEDGGEPGDIHITKDASPLVARAGDTITFRIHFRNTGDYNIHDVRIIDNLTPRLTYVDGTGKVHVPGDGVGDLTIIPNQDGGQTLQFELDQPLKGGQGGTITFKAKVR